MNRSTGKLCPWPTWVGAVLGVLVLSAAPVRVAARTYLPIDPPMPDGDPTADDQPSPTPKGGTYASVSPTKESSASIHRQTLSGSRLIWLSFVRTWIRIGMR